jgi:hypothetical protein
LALRTVVSLPPGVRVRGHAGAACRPTATISGADPHSRHVIDAHVRSLSVSG